MAGAEQRNARLHALNISVGVVQGTASAISVNESMLHYLKSSLYLKTCKADVVSHHAMYSVVCDLRNARKSSSDNTSQPADGVYETPTQTGQDEQRQYDVIQLGQTQPGGPDADHYDSLNPQTREEQSQYELIPGRQNDKDAPDYLKIMT